MIITAGIIIYVCLVIGLTLYDAIRWNNKIWRGK